jgi:putative transposase
MPKTRPPYPPQLRARLVELARTGSVGDAYDNALCESFVATLECELLDRRRFATQTQARLAVFDFIEGWYNPHLRHSALAYESPMRDEFKHCSRVA